MLEGPRAYKCADREVPVEMPFLTTSAAPVIAIVVALGLTVAVSPVLVLRLVALFGIRTIWLVLFR